MEISSTPKVPVLEDEGEASDAAPPFIPLAGSQRFQDSQDSPLGKSMVLTDEVLRLLGAG